MNEEEETQIWTDDQSNDSSDSLRSSHEWNQNIVNNSLFFVKFDLVCNSRSMVFDDDLFFRNEYRRLSTRKKESILSRFGQRDKSKHKLFRVSVIDASKKDLINGVQKDIIISIAPKKNILLKEVLPLTETILGITTSLFPDGRKLMVDKIKEYSVFTKGKLVKSKDWIKAIDTESVTVDNFESLLEGSTKIPSIVKITFFEMIEPDMSNSIEIKITNFMDLIQSQETLFDKEDIQTMSNNDLIFSMIYISKEYTQNDELDVKFCYPTRENNCLFNSRGSFVTLHSIFNHSFEQQSVMTCLKIRNVVYYTTYAMVDDGILLLGFNSKYSSVFAVKKKSEQICRCLNSLHHQSIGKAFNKPADQQTELMQLCEMIRHSIKANRHCDRFEKTFPQAHLVPLPKEIQLRIDDALGEIEAMDYRNWNDDFVDLFCMMTVIGCALYYKQHLVCTHLSGQYVMDVEAVLKNFGIFELFNTTDVKNLAIWRKFYPKQYCEEGFHEKNDAYLMLASIGSLLMVVILEVPIDTVHNKSFSRYIDEIQDMLKYFKSTGIEHLIRIWVESNRRPQCVSSNVTNMEPHQNLSPALNDERSQIAKGHDEESNASSSIKTPPAREENYTDHDDDDDSDWGQSVDSSQRSSSFDITDLSCESRCKEFSELVPTLITCGIENLLYYYVQLEAGAGCFLAPTFNGTTTPKTDIVMNLFRKTCTIIHTTFENSRKFRTLLINESSKLNTQRSLLPIKEQGIRLSLTKDHTSGERVDVWVIGRLFHSPAKELYVCLRADAPQNMVELAFRICLTCAG